VRTKFRKVVAYLITELREGRLKPGDKLPTHRELAYQHGLSLGTATRVFAELDSLGLTTGEVGRGTFVRMNANTKSTDFYHTSRERDFVDFSRNHLVLPEQKDILMKTMQDVVNNQDNDVLVYRNNSGSDYDRICAWKWLNSNRITPIDSYKNITICSGGQHGLLLCFLACCNPGDAVVVERYTYPGIRTLADTLGVELVLVEGDTQGICPNSFEKICKTIRPKALFCMPNLQNPTSVTMPLSRRKELLTVMEKYDVMAIEDDAYGFQLPTPPPSLSELNPERVFYLNTLSKSWAPGLRVGYLVSPADRAKTVDHAQAASVYMSTPLIMSAATQLIKSKQYDRIVEAKRKEIVKRQAILDRIFGNWHIQSDPRSMHVVIPLAQKLRADEVLSRLLENRIVAAPLSQFSAAHDAGKGPEGIRLCIGAPQIRAEMESGLEKTREIIKAMDSTGSVANFP